MLLESPVLHDPGESIYAGTDYIVDWSGVAGATSYSIDEATDSLFNEVTTVNSADTSLSFEHCVTETTTYYYRVIAHGENSVSEWSNIVTITVESFLINTFISDFETGDFTGWGKQFARDDSGIIVNSPVRKGNYAAKFTLSPGDTIHIGNRAEIYYKNDDPYKSAVYYAWSLMIDEQYSESEKWQMFVQFHDEPDWPKGETWETYTARRPPLGVLYMNGMMGVYINSIKYGHECIVKFPVEKGVWIDMILYIKWSLDDDGYIEAWKDGQPVTPFNGKNYKFYRPTVYNEVGNALKIGLYRDERITTTNTVYFDEVKIGVLYEDVAP